MKRTLLVLIINFSVVLTLIVTIEMIGQVVYRLERGRWIFQNRFGVFELHPYLAGRPKKDITAVRDDIRITIGNDNTRWTGRHEDDSKLIRIAVLGGSSTFGVGLTDRDTWPALLQSCLGSHYSVINFGVPGYSTAEAIIQMALIVPEWKPHFVILYQGWNDIRNYHETEFSADYYWHGITQYTSLSIPSFSTLYALSSIARFTGKIIKPTISRYLGSKSCHAFNTPDPFVDRIYVRNLKTLKLLSESLSAYTIFVPQVLNFRSYLDCPGAFEWTGHIENGAMPELLHRFNLLMRSVCSDDDPKCIFLNDVISERWYPEDFIDEGHFSKRGGEKFGNIVAELILKNTQKGDI